MADEWTIQQPPEEGAAFLLKGGIMVGRLYGGAPFAEIRHLLNRQVELHHHDDMLAHLIDEWGALGVVNQVASLCDTKSQASQMLATAQRDLAGERVVAEEEPT